MSSGTSTSLWQAAYIKSGIQKQDAQEASLQRKGGIREVAVALGLPFLLLCVLGVFPTVLYLRWAAAEGSSEATLSIGILCSFQDTLSFLLPLIDSMGLATALGAGSVFSGFIIGSFSGGRVFGGLALWASQKLYYDTWRHARTIFTYVLSIQVISVSMIFLVCSLPDMQPQGTWRAVLIVARIVGGFGAGVIRSLASNLVAHLVPPSERPVRMMSLNLAGTMGLGLAPFLSGAANFLVARVAKNTALADYEVMAWVGVWLPLFNLLCVRAFQSPEENTRDHEESLKFGESGGGTRRVVVVLCCLAAMPVRAFGIASLESALSYQLEVAHGWETYHVGFATAATFLSCIPVKAFFDRCKHVLSVTSWLRIWVGLSLVGVLMLHPLISSGASLLLVSCTITFPTLFLSGGLLNGIMQNHCFPHGSILDVNTCTLWTEWGNSLGRFLAPPAARWALAQAGQQAYWCQQLPVAMAAVLLAELVVQFQSEALMGCSAASRGSAASLLVNAHGCNEKQVTHSAEDGAADADANADDAKLGAEIKNDTAFGR